ncbi:MAG: 3-methyl-2-oxobutanoate hydroxymethyltransferase [Bacteriovoracaceae bacterium]|nr:3-methyl-2-oxobutanoate hydroxymethyltransferase [Bacteriovoracaceae bacterium]
MKTVFDFMKMKKRGEKISMVTCYDYWSAKIVEQSDVDCILVGDSLAMVMYGHESTIPVSIDEIARHVEAVRKGAPTKFIVGDLPFLSYRKGLFHSMECVEKLLKAGANAVKLEGVDGHEDIISHIIKSGIPVMGHLGLTPQSVHQFGGMKVQGKDDAAIEQLLAHARTLEKLGSFSIVLECIPQDTASIITSGVSIPTIGIGAGNVTGGQVLVLQDMLGMDPEFSPKFLKRYLNGFEQIHNALNHYNAEVKSTSFPSDEESY